MPYHLAMAPFLERVKRIELSQSAWKAEVLPLNYTRVFLSPAPSCSRAVALPSALESLTSVFGMGTGVTSPPLALDSVVGIDLPKPDTFFIIRFCLWLSPRSISTSPLRMSPCFHSWPIHLVVYKGSYL